MQDCIFCKIVVGEVPSSLVYTDANLVAFLDVAPISPGHTLVVTREHYPTVFDLPKGLAEEMLLAMQQVGQAVMQAVQAEGLNLLMNNHRPAGQLIPHAHWHLIPRKTGDGLLSWEQGEYESQEAMQGLAQEIREMIPGSVVRD
ncbi:MAG: HIT family protein [Desulfohalobiaceae bacterium]